MVVFGQVPPRMACLHKLTTAPPVNLNAQAAFKGADHTAKHLTNILKTASVVSHSRRGYQRIWWGQVQVHNCTIQLFKFITKCISIVYLDELIHKPFLGQQCPKFGIDRICRPPSMF